jgi:hypothetical protein
MSSTEATETAGTTTPGEPARKPDRAKYDPMLPKRRQPAAYMRHYRAQRRQARAVADQPSRAA